MLTKKEKRLIIGLRKNGRARVNAIAKENDLPVSSMADLLHKMEESKLLRHVTVPAYERLGFPIRMFITLKTPSEKRESLLEYFKASSNVNTIHHINTGHDFHVDCIFKNQKEAQDFIDDLEDSNSITEKHVFNLIDTIHHEQFMTDEHHFN